MCDVCVCVCVCLSMFLYPFLVLKLFALMQEMGCNTVTLVCHARHNQGLVVHVHT